MSDPKFFISTAAVKAELEALGRSHFTVVNPLDSGGYACVYTDEFNPERHCIAGQVIFNITGLAIPHDLNDTISGAVMSIKRGWNASEVGNYFIAQEVEFEDEAAEVLSAAQQIADGKSSAQAPYPDPLTPVPWGRVIRQLHQEGIL